jgi:hypothetical protein
MAKEMSIDHQSSWTSGIDMPPHTDICRFLISHKADLEEKRVVQTGECATLAHQYVLLVRNSKQKGDWCCLISWQRSTEKAMLRLIPKFLSFSHFLIHIFSTFLSVFQEIRFKSGCQEIYISLTG